MGVERIPKLIMRMSLPMMLSMLVQALYNVVDSIFVARYSEAALTAVSLAFPLQNLIIAFAVGTGVGVNSILARRLGEKNYEDANKAANTGIFLAFATYIAFLLAGLFFARPFLSLFTANAQLLDLSVQYAMICMCFSMGCFVDITGERILQATGDSFHPMIIQAAGAITNIILDPIFIFTFDMGVAGAAIATVIGQWVSMFLAIYYVRKNQFVQIKMRRIRPARKLIKDIYVVGAPTIVMNSVSTVLVSALNGILIAFSNMAVSVFGVYYKLQSFVFMPVFGLNNGLIPILAFNFGAKNRKRMTTATKYGLVIAVLPCPAHPERMFCSCCILHRPFRLIPGNGTRLFFNVCQHHQTAHRALSLCISAWSPDRSDRRLAQLHDRRSLRPCGCTDLLHLVIQEKNQNTVIHASLFMRSPLIVHKNAFST